MKYVSMLLCLLALLGACGGGDPAPDAQAAAVREQPSAKAQATPAPPELLLSTSQLLDWAELTYPTLFPGHKPNLTLAPYEYRHYPETGNYVGVAGEDVYILGPVSNQELRRVGAVEDFRCRVLPSSCVATDYPRAGWTASLSTLQHGVSGTVTIVDERRLRITGFNYDGGGPRVYVYVGASNNNSSFTSGLPIGAQLQSRPYVNETIELQLPKGQTLDDHTAVSIWCVEFRVNFGSGVFTAPKT